MYAAPKPEIGAVLDTTFAILKNHIFYLAQVGLVALIPAAVLQISIFHGLLGFPTGISFTGPDPAYFESLAEDPAKLITALTAGGIAGVLIAACYLWYTVAIIKASASVFVGEPLPLGDAYRSSASRILPFLGTSILSSLFIMLGMIAFLIPGIMLAFSYMFMNQVVVLEEDGGYSALKRSAFLTKGYRWRLFGLSMVVGIVVAMISGAGGLIPILWLQILINSVGQAVGTPIQMVAVIAFYYAARSEKELFDLQQLVQPQDPTGGMGGGYGGGYGAGPSGGNYGDMGQTPSNRGW